MNIWYRVKVVAVMNALVVVSLLFVDIIWPGAGYAWIWASSPSLQVVGSLVFWLASPFVYRVLDGRRKKGINAPDKPWRKGDE